MKVSAFADDLAVWQSGRDIPKLVEDMQWAAGMVSGWCKEWLIQILVKKCSVALFSLSAKYAPLDGVTVKINGKEVRKERSPCFLGVNFD